MQLLQIRIFVTSICRQALEVVDGRNGGRGELLVRLDSVGRALDSDVAHVCDGCGEFSIDFIEVLPNLRIVLSEMREGRCESKGDAA